MPMAKTFGIKIVCQNKINDSKTFLQNIYQELTVNFSCLILQMLLAQYIKLLQLVTAIRLVIAKGGKMGILVVSALFGYM